MFNRENFHLIDFLKFLQEKKKYVVIVFILSLILTYIGVYFFVEEQFEATALIIPQEDNSTSLGGNLMRSMKALSVVGGKTSSTPQIGEYKTIIYSRTMLEDILHQFNLIVVYKLDTNDVEKTEKALKILKSDIYTTETEEEAFIITVRANSRQRSADIANYIVKKLNEKIIDLQVAQARDNRIFLANRLKEIYDQLHTAENSMRLFQEETGLLDVKSQIPEVIKSYTLFETELNAKKMQQTIYEHLFGTQSAQLEEINLQIKEYEKRLDQMRSTTAPGSAILALKKIPQNSVEYLRRYREVEINNMILEYITPLYEQAKVEEEKNCPILRVIDYAVPPVKKSFPPRILIALLSAFTITVCMVLYLLMHDVFWKDMDPRWKTFWKDMRLWSKKN